MFRIYYGDGSTYSGDPFFAPRLDVQVIAQRADNPRGRILSHGKDFYYWQDKEGWWPTDLLGLTRWLEKCPPNRLQILCGENCPEFDEILKRAIEEGLG
jgi:hypothetical protein